MISRVIYRRSIPLVLVLGLFLMTQVVSSAATMNEIADTYVKLVLALGEHDSGYVDAYYGPEQWKLSVRTEKLSLPVIQSRVTGLQKTLKTLRVDSKDGMHQLRYEYLIKQLAAIYARTQMLEGRKFSFDEESLLLYDAVAPSIEESEFATTLQEINELLPGDGRLDSRVDAYRKQFIIPKDKLKRVFSAAIAACKQRTLEYIDLPEPEHFQLEYVTDKPWSGYNWYQGNSFSVIQINTDLPIYIERAIDLGCHEGYPGHHTYNVLLEEALVKQRGWVEYSIYPLYSPQSLIAEGSANYGIDMAFPGKERLTFEKEVLFPLAGLDARSASRYFRLRELLSKLSYAGNEAARDYLDGRKTKKETIDWQIKFELRSVERAEQRVSFFDTYRAYVINYNVGKDKVKAYIETHSQDEKSRWRVFSSLLSSPRLPSGLD